MTANPFSKGALLALILAGLFALGSLAVLSSFAPDLRQGGDPGAHALSKSAIGYGGLVELLRLQGETVVVSRTASPPIAPNALLIATPDIDMQAAQWDRFKTPGALLVVLPKWTASADPRNRDWATRQGLAPAGMIESGPATIVHQPRILRRKTAAPDRVIAAGSGAVLGALPAGQVQAIAAPGLTPVLTDEFGDILLAKVADRDVFILAEPDLISTYALRDLGGARTAMAVLDAVRDGPVVFDVTLNGFERGRSLWKLAFQPPFLGATLCALAATLLMGLHAAVRFGPPLREGRAVALGKRALADNQAGLVRMAGREARMALPYARLVRDRTAKAVGAGPAADEAALNTVLDRLGGRRTELSISALMAEAAAADSRSLMRLARRLHQWKLEITRERQ